jgi:hypothetical protein
LRRERGWHFDDLAAVVAGLVLQHARNPPQPFDMIARLSPAFARTFLPGCSTVPLAERTMFATLRSSITTRPWSRVKRLPVQDVKSVRRARTRALSAANLARVALRRLDRLFFCRANCC